MEILFVGTGSGITSLKRHHSSILITGSKERLLIDTGDGISKALLYQQINFNSITSILFSHFHPDHVMGLSSLLVQMKKNERQFPLKIFLHSSLKERLIFLLENSYLFINRLGFTLNIEPFENNNQIKVSDEIKFIPRANSHLDKLKGEKENLSVSSSSFLFYLEDKSFHYTADIGESRDLNLFDDLEKELIISEITHVSPGEVYEHFKKNDSNLLIFTHISEKDEERLLNFVEEISDDEKEKIIVALDGLTIEL